MSNTPILDLPVAIGLDGSEYFPLVQGGTTKRAQTGLLFDSGGIPGTTEAANTFELGPVSGPPAAPTFRLAKAADIGRGSAGTSGYLLSTDGSNQSWQGFLQTGTGAVTRTWASKNQDIVSVLDFGAVGDGSFDNAAAFAAAVASLSATGGGTVFVPRGSYRFTSAGVTDGSYRVRFIGEGRPTILFAGPNDITTITLNHSQSAIEKMSVVGPNNRAATGDAIHLASGAVAAELWSVYASCGRYGLNLEAGDHALHQVDVGVTYGDAHMRLTAGGHHVRVSSDHGWPGDVPPPDTVFSPWAAGTPYALNTQVSLNGWYIQAIVGGTSGGTAPTLADHYGESFTDGSVTWALVAPTIYYSMKMLDGAGIGSVLGDYSGPYTAALYIDESCTASSYFSTNATFYALQYGVLVNGGGDLKIIGAIYSGGQDPNSIGVYVSSTAMGPVTIIGGHMVGFKQGVYFNAGADHSVNGLAIYPGNKTSTVGVRVGASISGISVVSNIMNGSSSFGTLSVGTQIDSGADYVMEVGNTYKGVPTPVLNNSTGTHITTSANSLWTFGTTGGRYVTIDPTGSGTVLEASANASSSTATAARFTNQASGATNIVITGARAGAHDWALGTSVAGLADFAVRDLTAGGATRLYLNSSGGFGIGTASAPSTAGATAAASWMQILSATSIPAGGTAGSGYTFSSTSNFGTFFGSGVPTLSAAQGSLYLRSDGSPYYNTNGTTGWANLLTSGTLTVGSTAIASGTTTRILYDNAGVLGEYTLSGSGTAVAMATSPSLTTPTLGVAIGTSLALGGATLGSNALAVTGGVAGSAQVWSGSVSSALSTLTGGSDGFRTSAANVTQFAGENTTSSSATQGGFFGGYSNDGAAMASGDRLGGVRVGGSSSASALRNSALIAGFADQAWVDASAYGSRWEFQTTTNSATSATTKLILGNAGVLSFGATAANTVPALKPSSTTLKVRLGDDSADAPLSASTLNATATASSLQIASTKFADQAAGATYFIIYSPDGNQCFVFGAAGDPTNYYNNTNHILRSADGGTQFIVVSASSTQLRSTTTQVTGTLRIDQAPATVSAAGPVLIGSGSTIDHRVSINMNGTTYWFPCSTSAF